MVNLKATVRVKTKSGLYPVYIRFTKSNQVSYVKTSWVVNEKGLKNKKEITDPFVLHQTSMLIDSYYCQLNLIDTSKWTTSEIVKYLTEFNNDLSFSDYVRKHIEKLIGRGQERTSRNYKWAIQHMERFAGTDNIMFSRITSSFLNRWIESLSDTNRCKEQYPVCMREVYKAAMKEFNDEELGIVKLKNPWTNVSIPQSDIPEKRAITASMLRKFFNVVPDRSRFTNPLMEVGQDVALISFCMCGLNAVDIFNAKKEQYVNGFFHYERQKTRMSRSDKGYFEIRVPEFLKPTFEKYLSKKVGSPWLFNFHDRLSTSDSFSANVNIGIKQIVHIHTTDGCFVTIVCAILGEAAAGAVDEQALAHIGHNVTAGAICVLINNQVTGAKRAGDLVVNGLLFCIGVRGLGFVVEECALIRAGLGFCIPANGHTIQNVGAQIVVL